MRDQSSIWRACGCDEARTRPSGFEPMRPISVAQMVEVDRLAIGEYGVTLPQMMENAGRSLAVVARTLLGGSAAGRRVIALIGKGNNGGGGLVAARHLSNAGARVTVALSGPPDELGDVPERQRRTLVRMGIAGSDRATSVGALASLLEESDLLLDALTGYSLSGAPREPLASYIRLANAAGTPRLALDLPSGLDGDQGVPHEPCLRADATLTLAWPKVGLLTANARPMVGELYVADIGIPSGVYRAVGVDPGTLFARAPIVRVRSANGVWRADARVQELG